MARFGCLIIGGLLGAVFLICLYLFRFSGVGF